MIKERRLKDLIGLPTPFYFYDIDLLQETIAYLSSIYSPLGYHVHYALKANANERLLKVIKDAGLGADCVSGNEVRKAINTGFDPDHVVYAGVGKTDDEIKEALNYDIFGFNCESYQELQVIEQLAKNADKSANIFLRLNPNVDARTHKNITTGLEENKFGINLWELDDILNSIKSLTHIKLKGIHFHIGSQITDLSGYVQLCHKANELNRWFEDQGISLQHINLGGGLGINYENPHAQLIPDFKTYFSIFKDYLEVRTGQQVHFELGRTIVGQCGVLISKVLYEKSGKNRRFLILDAGMTELMRPALYQAVHHMENLSTTSDDHVKYDVVGPICETTDAFGREIELPESKRGDYLAIYSTGAYGEVLKNNYNLRDYAHVVYSDEL